MTSELIGARRVAVQARWGASPLTVMMGICCVVTFAMALIASRGQIIVFAAPMMGVLCSISRQPRIPAVHLCVETETGGFFENECVQLTIWVEANADAATRLSVSTVPGMTLDIQEQCADRLTVTCSAARWGRYPLRAHLSISARGGLMLGTATVDAVDLYVFPVAPMGSTAIPRTELPDRIGTHVGRRVGAGVEYADIRPYTPGDQLRAVNWPVSARRRRLHVTDRHSEQAADVVVLLDTYPQPPGPASEATERTVRGAMQVVQTALQRGDRAGIVTLGDRQTRWLPPDIGRRQFYRVLDATISGGDEVQSAVSSLVPRLAVPSGAVVIAFSTLLSSHFASAVLDLRRHGHPVVIVDVLRGTPSSGEPDPLVARIWSLERTFMYRDLRTAGIEVVPWRDGQTLDEAMALIPDRRANR